MLQEMAKPEGQRLEWLFRLPLTQFCLVERLICGAHTIFIFRWIDADIVVMNPNIPLEIFIPPSPEFTYVNMLATNDRHGRNNGFF